METSSFSGNASSSGSNAAVAATVGPLENFNSGATAWKDFSHAQQETIVRHFAPKVKYLALRLKARLPQNVELSELISAGTLGLMESFGKFRPDLNVKFDTYAESRIRGAMLDELRGMDWLPRSLRQRVRVLDEAIQRLEGATGTMPTEEQLAAETGLDAKEVRQGLEALQVKLCLSLDAIQDSVAGEGVFADGEPYARAAEQEILDRVSSLIDQLTPREKLVLSLYYTDELNMRETAEVMGITEGRVSQLHTQALMRLRREFVNAYGTHPV
ncbi:MAG: FliA/WhiG family RNA polymerase sigma factor [Deltaproteobacteria bacterium]|jgi:RNA polymerase sigma factor for flagellar operon FliA|nr:FliA/WhiG family RNA polymerase sigma factor [Deltaproteobacteria bacterium]